MIDYASRIILVGDSSKCDRCPHAYTDLDGTDGCYEGFAGPDEDCDWEEDDETNN